MAAELRSARELLQSIVGTSPWEHRLDDRLGGVLVALYDLIGKAVDLPVSRLFSSSPRSPVRQTWWRQCFPPDLKVSEARCGADLGYRVHKVKARPWEDPMEQGEAKCEVVPRDMRVWVDANAWWGSLGCTLHFCEQLAAFDNYFAIESPFARERTEDYRRLRRRTALLVSEHMPPDPMPFIRDGLIDAFLVGKPMGRTLVQRALMSEKTRIPLWVEHSISSGVN